MNDVLMHCVIALCLLLMGNNKIECHEIELHETIKPQYDSEKEEKVNNTTNKLICFYVLTKDFSPTIMDGLCTHINVGFFGINKKNNTLDISDDQELILQQIILLKEKGKDLKVLISVGGAGDVAFSSMVMNHTTRKAFIKSCMETIKRLNIDGVDLDWEWPVVNDGNIKEKVKFVQLLHEFRKEFARHKKQYILSADVASAQSVIELGYYVNYIAEYVDYVNVMCYDYHYFTKIYPFTGHNAPLYSTSDPLLRQNINKSLYFWISNSMPREKIVVGLPTYGHTFKLIFSNQNSLKAPAKGFGSIGESGFASYQQICEFLKLNNSTVVYDEVSKVPYAHNFPEWISYDDEGSLAIKAQNLSKPDYQIKKPMVSQPGMKIIVIQSSNKSVEVVLKTQKHDLT